MGRPSQPSRHAYGPIGNPGCSLWPYWQPYGSYCAMARRAGAPGAKTERAWRHGGPGLRAWRRLGRFQCAWRHLLLFSVRLAPSSALFSALGASSGFVSILSVDTFAPRAPIGVIHFLKSNSFLYFKQHLGAGGSVPCSLPFSRHTHPFHGERLHRAGAQVSCAGTVSPSLLVLIALLDRRSRRSTTNFQHIAKLPKR